MESHQGNHTIIAGQFKIDVQDMFPPEQKPCRHDQKEPDERHCLSPPLGR
jgi:hypothetical protein